VARGNVDGRRSAVIEFDAYAAAFLRDEDLEAEVLVIAEHEDGSGHRVELQRAFVFTAEDRRLGMDTYCIVDETGATHYGGVDSWSLEDGLLEIRLSPETAQDLGIDGGYCIRLVGAQSTVDVVKEGLPAVLQ
jgi:hypothetical protein